MRFILGFIGAVLAGVLLISMISNLATYVQNPPAPLAAEDAALLAGKVVSLSPFIDTSVHGIRGGSRPQDLEAAFQLLYLTFTG